MTREAEKKAMIARIREHYGNLGIPLDDLSDRQIELGVRQLAAAAREAGMSQDEAREAMRKAVDQAARSKEEKQAAASESG